MIGLDIGSTTAKIVFFEDNKVVDYKITKSHLWKTLIDIERNTKKIASTGYFRKSVPNAHTVTEITSSIYGITHFFKDVEVVVDIGGQDTKIVDLRTNSFTINDKCSAGTGAFLELIAQHFNVGLNELGSIAQKATKIAQINSTCAVFAISEIVSQLVHGFSIEETIAGVHSAFAKKIAQMIPKNNKTAVIGGVAKNKALMSFLSKYLDSVLLLPDEPQIVNAIGALKYAFFTK